MSLIDLTDILSARPDLIGDIISSPSSKKRKRSAIAKNIENIPDDNIEKFELVSDLPDGVISESVSDSSAQLVIDSKTVGGHEIKYRATTEKGKTKDFTVTVVDEDHIEIDGNDKMAIPLDGEDNEQYT